MAWNWGHFPSFGVQFTTLIPTRSFALMLSTCFCKLSWVWHGEVPSSPPPCLVVYSKGNCNPFKNTFFSETGGKEFRKQKQLEMDRTDSLTVVTRVPRFGLAYNFSGHGSFDSRNPTAC